MRFILIVIAALFVTGCVSQQERDAIAMADCEKLGFTPGTEGMGNCVLQARALREQKRANAIAAGASANAINNSARNGAFQRPPQRDRPSPYIP